MGAYANLVSCRYCGLTSRGHGHNGAARAALLLGAAHAAMVVGHLGAELL